MDTDHLLFVSEVDINVVQKFDAVFLQQIGGLLGAGLVPGCYHEHVFAEVSQPLRQLICHDAEAARLGVVAELGRGDHNFFHAVVLNQILDRLIKLKLLGQLCDFLTFLQQKVEEGEEFVFHQKVLLERFHQVDQVANIDVLEEIGVDAREAVYEVLEGSRFGCQQVDSLSDVIRMNLCWNLLVKPFDESLERVLLCLLLHLKVIAVNFALEQTGLEELEVEWDLAVNELTHEV